LKRAWLLIVTVALAAVGCLWFVLSGQYAAGNVYQEYSSQRTDRWGTSALYEALGRIGREVSRNEVPLDTSGLKGAEVMIIGLSPPQFTGENISEIEGAARNGNRVVIALDTGDWIFNYKKINEELWSKWHVRILDTRKTDDDDADAASRARDYVKFEGWQGSESMVSRAFGSGSIVLTGGSWAFTNQALKEDRDLARVQAAVGDSKRVVFDETHLGSVHTGTMMGLVRRFRLQGVLFVAIACALLFIWQSSAPFPPERAVAKSDLQLAAASASEGLLNLLTVHIPANRIVAACVEEWRKDRGRLVGADKLSRMGDIVAQKAHPVEQWREIQALLNKTKT
jgi:hypothetical protein